MAIRHAVLAAATALLLAGCGGSSGAREPVVPVETAAPADLCALVPNASKTGLEDAATSDTSGNPTAACSLRSAPGRQPSVRVVITWTELDGEDAATDVLQSQCRSIDTTEYAVVSGFTAQGADEACGANGSLPKTDEATLAARAGDAVLTVRLSSQPAGDPPALQRGTQVLEGVIGELGSSDS